MTYNMTGLEDLAGVPNIGTVIERIDHAATRAAVLYRMVGVTWSRKGQRFVPTQDDIDQALRALTVDAADACFQLQDDARAAVDQKTSVDGVSSFAADDNFKVVAACSSDGSLEIEILLRLV
jgi:hypothetical protein